MLDVRHISKKFGSFSLKEVSFHVDQDDYFVLLGSSGSGKSLLLELIAGLEFPDAGAIFLRGDDITRFRIQHRKTGIVFQDLALFPHLNVRDNILYPVHARKLPKEQSLTLMNELLSRLEIGHLLQRKPLDLSGGEKQRVALARVLMYRPEVLLLDEPLSSLDVQLKEGIRNLLRKINREGQTILHVTHDYSEALSLATRIAVIHDGRIIQEGSPDAVFKNPSSAFVASFVGIRNYITVNEENFLQSDPSSVRIHQNLMITTHPRKSGNIRAVVLDSRKILLSRDSSFLRGKNLFQGEITEIIPVIDGIEVKVDIGLPVVSWMEAGAFRVHNYHPGEKVWMLIPEDAVECLM